ncbi:MAG: hypothetical protein AAGC74_02660 [Verrucomicrobiota bacterium]
MSGHQIAKILFMCRILANDGFQGFSGGVGHVARFCRPLVAFGCDGCCENHGAISLSTRFLIAGRALSFFKILNIVLLKNRKRCFKGWVADFEKAFELLGELMEGEGFPALRLVVCGGSALQVAQVISRVTKDVDVLALRGEVDGEILRGHPLPDDLMELSRQVALELALPENWLNSQTAFLMPDLNELPTVVWEDLREQDYGSRLRISFVGRKGLIVLKVFAIFGRSEQRDLDDLRALRPTKDDVMGAIHWLERGEFLVLEDKRMKDVMEVVEDED